jgi:hypothetical protein
VKQQIPINRLEFNPCGADPPTNPQSRWSYSQVSKTAKCHTIKGVVFDVDNKMLIFALALTFS